MKSFKFGKNFLVRLRLPTVEQMRFNFTFKLVVYFFEVLSITSWIYSRNWIVRKNVYNKARDTHATQLNSFESRKSSWSFICCCRRKGWIQFNYLGFNSVTWKGIHFWSLQLSFHRIPTRHEKFNLENFFNFAWIADLFSFNFLFLNVQCPISLIGNTNIEGVKPFLCTPKDVSKETKNILPRTNVRSCSLRFSAVHVRKRRVVGKMKSGE